MLSSESGKHQHQVTGTFEKTGEERSDGGVFKGGSDLMLMFTSAKLENISNYIDL